MPASTDSPKRWTAQMVRETFDLSRPSPRYEVIDGELLVSYPGEDLVVTNAPSVQHQRAVRVLLRLLDAYVGVESLGEVFIPAADVELEPDTIVQPDVFVAPTFAGRAVNEWSEVRTLLLVIEVVSPTTARYDRATKRRFYQRVGVAEYWIVDLDARLVERWRPGDDRPEVVEQRLVWRPQGAAEAFALELAVFFAEAHAEEPPPGA